MTNRPSPSIVVLALALGASGLFPGPAAARAVSSEAEAPEQLSASGSVPQALTENESASSCSAGDSATEIKASFGGRSVALSLGKGELHGDYQMREKFLFNEADFKRIETAASSGALKSSALGLTESNEIVRQGHVDCARQLSLLKAGNFALQGADMPPSELGFWNAIPLLEAQKAGATPVSVLKDYIATQVGQTNAATPEQVAMLYCLEHPYEIDGSKVTQDTVYCAAVGYRTAKLQSAKASQYDSSEGRAEVARLDAIASDWRSAAAQFQDLVFTTGINEVFVFARDRSMNSLAISDDSAARTWAYVAACVANPRMNADYLESVRSTL